MHRIKGANFRSHHFSPPFEHVLNDVIYIMALGFKKIPKHSEKNEDGLMKTGGLCRSVNVQIPLREAGAWPLAFTVWLETLGHSLAVQP